MSESVLEIKNVSKYYGKNKVVDNVSFSVEKGQILGFLGPNGAGKSTTMKMLLGLTAPTDGEFQIDNLTFPNDRVQILKKIGSFIESPSFYQNLTGKENLDIIRRILDLPASSVDEALELVGLSEFGNRLAKKYSLGMKQRLGLASALLGEPPILILDEPTNGLDPVGIKELRDILKKLARENGTAILVSSHILSEMELMCDRVGIIANGKMIGVHTLEEMISASNSKFSEFMIRVDDNAAALALIDVPEDKKKLVDGMIEVSLSTENADELISKINFMLISNGIKLYTVSQKENKKLEDVFIELTKDQKGGGQIG